MDTDGNWLGLSHSPAKWVSGDGKTLKLVFSGDDSFSVREGTLILHDPPHEESFVH
jgi:hypothetical protein